MSKPTVTLTFAYKLTADAQRALVLAGTPVALLQTVQATVDAQEAIDRRAAHISERGAIEDHHGVSLSPRPWLVSEDGSIEPGWSGTLTTDHILTPEEALSIWRGLPAESERLKAALASEAEERRAKYAQRLAWEAGAPDREEAERRAKERAAEKAREERDAWIRAHGSERLRLALDLGEISNAWGAYRDERLAVERPGWEWDHTDKEDDRLNPSLDELRALAEARKTDPDVRLQSLPTDKEDEDCNVIWAPALASRFLGKPILRWL